MPTRTGEDYLRLKDRIIDRTLRELNPMQRQAAKAVTGPVLVLAGAGSGKTTVLVHRIATLLRFGTAPDTSEDFPGTLSEEDWALLERAAGSGEELEEASGILARSVPEPWNILAITFTNKAASELKNRLELLLGAQGAGVAASTFHSACARILRREIGVLGYSGRFTIYDTDDSVRVMKQVLRDLSVSDRLFSPKEILGRISRAKDIMWSPRDLQEHAGRNYALQVAGRAYGEYQKKLRADNAVDFDDLIFLTVRLFQEHPEILERYQRRFRYILVDEYQDTNHAQYLLISLLAGKHGNLFVVGDDDQSIYRFRGATIENILSFENRFQQARVIRLEQNYRSTRVILEAANAVIGHNRERKGKTLWTDNAEGERITVSRLEDERAEATFVARRIRADHEAGTPYRDNAILYRLNAQSNSMEWALRSHGIPYRVFGGLKFFDRKEVKDILSYLAVVSNPADDLRFRRIVNEPKRGIGNTTLERASEIAEALGQSVFETCSQAEDYPALAEKAAALRGITGWIARLAGQADEAPLTETLDAVLECSGYVRALRQKKSEENEARIQNIEELRSTVINYERETEEPTLSGFLEEIALFTDLDSLRESEDAVLMMTLHSSKGLEFENVYLIGMEENIFPGYQSGGSPELLEEERRLAYVGITRARRRLTLLCAERRMLYGRTSCNPVSRFIAEIPGSCTGPGRPPAGAGRAPRDRRTFPPGAAGAPERKRTAAPPGPAAAFAAGDRVRHPVFGSGLVRNARIIGGDQLLEIVFEKAGVKKIMANFAKLEKQ